ncbi:hypothetical protein Tco_0885047, partial [Tanacetum coccineum]
LKTELSKDKPKDKEVSDKPSDVVKGKPKMYSMEQALAVADKPANVVKDKADVVKPLFLQDKVKDKETVKESADVVEKPNKVKDKATIKKPADVVEKPDKVNDKPKQKVIPTVQELSEIHFESHVIQLNHRRFKVIHLNHMR